MELITRNDPKIVKIFSDISICKDILEELRDHFSPTFLNDRYLTDKELSKMLKISRRTLQEYRNTGRIPYIHLGGKIIYKLSEVEKLLEKSYVREW